MVKPKPLTRLALRAIHPLPMGEGKQASVIAPVPSGYVYAPLFFNGAGAPSSFCLALDKSEGTERRAAHPLVSAPFDAGVLWRRTRAVRRSIAASLQRRVALSPGELPSVSASSWQGTVVSPGGAPAPPGG